MGELPFLTGEQGKGPLLLLLFFVSVSVVAFWGTWEGTLPANSEAVLASEARYIYGGGDLPPGQTERIRSFETPPLTLWITGGFCKLLGANIFAARLAFVLFSLLTCFTVYLAGERLESLESTVSVSESYGKSSDGWKDKKHSMGLLSAAVFAATPLFGRFATHLNTNVILSFFVVLSLLGWLYLPSRRTGYVLWGLGLAGGVACGDSIALIVIPASVVSLIVDRTRRGVWMEWQFITITLLSVVAGRFVGVYGMIKGWESYGLKGEWGFISSLGRLAGENFEDLSVHSIKFWIRTLPWSIPSVSALVRILIVERWGKVNIRTSSSDRLLLVFLAVVFIPVALVRSIDSGATLPAVSIVALISSREIARWFRSDLNKIWSFNRVVTAVFSLLLILLVITPVRLHRFEKDPIEDIARVTCGLVEKNETVGNYRQKHRFQSARLLFYGNRLLDKPLETPDEVKMAVEQNRGKIFLSAIEDLRKLRSSKRFGGRVEVLYRAGNLALFTVSESEFTD